MGFSTALFNRVVRSIKRRMRSPMMHFACRSRTFRRITKYGYYGVNGLDYKIEKYLSRRPGFYVELGANNGIAQSNTLFLEKYYGYHGVLVEPNLENFELCKTNRGPNNSIFNVACVSFEYPNSTMRMMYSNLMTIGLFGISDVTDRVKHAKEGERYLKGAKSREFEVETRTLNRILNDTNAPRIINFLSLDVEGGELEVLKGVNHDEYRFNVICVESRDIQKISEYLTERKYQLIKELSQHDYLFLHEEYALTVESQNKTTYPRRLRVSLGNKFAKRGVS